MSDYENYSHCTLVHTIHERDDNITRLELLLSERDAEIKRLKEFVDRQDTIIEFLRNDRNAKRMADAAEIKRLREILKRLKQKLELRVSLQYDYQHLVDLAEMGLGDE